MNKFWKDLFNKDQDKGVQTLKAINRKLENDIKVVKKAQKDREQAINELERLVNELKGLQ